MTTTAGGSGIADDHAFDEQLPRRLQTKAAVHFTPVAVARVAARLLAPEPGMRVLDVGAGPGKFCLVAGSAVPHGTFVGVELRPHLVRLARRIARGLALTNVQFVDGDALDLDWSAYDAFYLYNPFAEQLCDTARALDRRLDLAPFKFREYVRAVRERLLVARVGTRIVTYHGFGAPPPDGYDLVATERTDDLELWIKARPSCATSAELDLELVA